ncbi:MAG: hypothetical protein LBV44_05320 [Methylobacillus sp.]|jgi:hypothetical protein|nr:hypothetical protein [Methylobacillus sp.]
MWKTLVNLMLAGLLLGMTLGVAAQDNESSEPPSSLSKTMEWQMIPGESLNALSRLFYPKSGAMQHIFVKSTLDLNRDQRPDLTADYKFADKTTIVIPTLIDLSRHAPRVARVKSDSDATATSASATETTAAVEEKPAPEKRAKKLSKKQQEELQSLEQRSEDRKKELDDLNARLKSLEEQTKSQDAAIKDADQKIKDTQAKSGAPAQPGN